MRNGRQWVSFARLGSERHPGAIDSLIEHDNERVSMESPSADPIRDPARLRTLRSTGLLDSAVEESFDRLTQLASRLLRAPVALISLVDADRQFFKSSVGLGEPWASRRETNLSHSFCQYVVAQKQPLIVPDARNDPILRDNGAIEGLGVVAYLGVPLIATDGQTLGSLCAIDTQPRSWNDEDLQTLLDLADSVMSKVLLRTEALDLRRAQTLLAVQYATAIVLSESATLAAAVGRILRIIGQGLDLDVGEFWSVDSATSLLTRSNADWWSPDFGPGYGIASHPCSLARGQGIAGRVWNAMEPIWIDDWSNVTRPMADIVAAHRLKESVGFPIVSEAKPIGIMTFLTRREMGSDPQLMRMFASLGAQIGQFALRCQAEQEVHGLNARLNAILDAATQFSIISTDERGVIQLFNTGAERLLGYSREELVGRATPEAFHDVEEVKLRGAELTKTTGAPVSGFDVFVEPTRHGGHDEREWTYLRKDGERRTVSLAVTPVRSTEGRLIGFLGIAKDITDQVRIAEEMRTLSALVEHSSDVILLISLVGSVLYMNPAGCELLGFDDSEAAKAAGILDYVLDGVTERTVWRAITVALASGNWHREGRVRNLRTGEIIDVEIDLFPVFTPRTGQPLCLGAILRDCRQRRRAETALRLSEERFRGAFDFSAIGMALVAPGGRFLMVNTSLCEIVGYSRTELLGLTFQEITDADDLVGQLVLLDRMLAGEIPSYQLEKRYIHKDGTPVWVVVSVSLVSDTAGAPLHWVLLVNDISARKRAEEELLLARDMAMAATRSKSEFLANMSHEVRTPMAAVLGYSEMLLDPALTQPERDHALQAIRRDGAHLLQIINDVLDLSKIEAGKIELEQVSYSPWQSVLEVMSSLRARADERDLILHARAVSSLPALMTMDPTRVRQIIYNLVSNAIKFSNPGGFVAVRIGTARPPASGRVDLQLEVEDQGIGMSADQIEQVFRPFQQADTSTTRRFGGTGLGLSIVRRLTEEMGGNVNVNSTPGQGSCFRVTLSLATVAADTRWLPPDELATEAAPYPRPDDPLFGSRFAGRVLLAEDNPDNQRVLSYHLRRLGVAVEIAENGLIAVEKAMATPFDLILMDMQMPGLDGYGATSSLRRSGYDRPIIALTAHAMKEDRDRCLRVGCNDYLTKPLNLTLFLKTLSNYLIVENAADTPIVKTLSDVGSASAGCHDAEAVLSDFRHDTALRPLIQDYVDTLPDRVAEIVGAHTSGDHTRLESLAHQTKGVGGMYGYPDLSEVASLIEQAARERQPDELVKELIDELDSLVRRIRIA
jgi:PAS domain S-box-containing protein